MRVELLYFDGCPNWTVAEERLHEALRSVDRNDVHVAKVRVGSPQEAEELGFIGSPTIRFDGVDPFASGGELVGLACRVYATPDGLRGSPTTAQLVEVLGPEDGPWAARLLSVTERGTFEHGTSVLQLREDQGIYMAGSGRFNVVGLSDESVGRFAAAILEKMDG